MTAPRLGMALLVALVAPLALAGCASEGASESNFALSPERIGWYAGEEATFDLVLEPSLTRKAPTFTLDRNFAIEEIRLNDKAFDVGGDYETRNSDDVNLRLMREGEVGDEFVLDVERPEVQILLTLPGDLEDSEYVLELKLFKVGWIKSESFRVDRR